MAERGGGLLVLGARSFERQGLAGTALEEALPIDLTSRRADHRAVPATAVPAQQPNAPALDRGRRRRIRRRGWRRRPRRTGERWAQLPSLASVAHVGGAAARRAGAGRGPRRAGGDPQPLIAAQRYGQGRSMVFAGEASWRWRMLRPATDNSYETIWRQLARWITAGAAGTGDDRAR